MVEHTERANEKPSEALQNYLKVVEETSDTSFANDGERMQALSATYALMSRLETPWETLLRLCAGQPAIGAVLKVTKDLELFEKWHEHGDGAMRGDQLAEIVSCDPLLLVRLLRHLTANHMLQEPSPGVFKPTSFTLALLDPVFGEFPNFLYDLIIPCFQTMPSYLTKTSYQNPTSQTNGIFQSTKGWKGDVYQYYAAHPREGHTFSQVIGGVMAHQASWLDIFPYQTLLDSADPSLPLLVDVGGSIGHDMEKFRQVHPETASRLYLEDKPEVIERSMCPDPVNKVGYDFFTPQPIKGARIYYLHAILHNWSDPLASKILEMQRRAMKQDYSTLLVHDMVVEAEGRAHPHATAYDLTMMIAVAGEERTEERWRMLLRDAGFEIRKIWRSPKAAQCIIEAEVAK